MIQVEEGDDSIDIMFDEELLELYITVNEQVMDTDEFVEKYNKVFNNLVYSMMKAGVDTDDEEFVRKVKLLYFKYKGNEMNIKIATEKGTDNVCVFVNNHMWETEVFKKAFPEQLEEVIEEGMRRGLEEENYMLCKYLQDLKDKNNDTKPNI